MQPELKEWLLDVEHRRVQSKYFVHKLLVGADPLSPLIPFRTFQKRARKQDGAKPAEELQVMQVGFQDLMTGIWQNLFLQRFLA